MKTPHTDPPRVQWEVLPIRGLVGWRVTRNGLDQCTFFFKYRAVNFAVRECQAQLEWNDTRSELTIKGRNGRIQDKRTYGADPRRIRG
jgi:hypothetical protein